MSKTLADLPIRALVKDVGTTLYGKPIIFDVADKNHAGYPANSVTLVTDKIIEIMGFDGAESNNGNGNPRYSLSNLRQYGNHSGGYSPTHSDDAPPNAQNMTDNPYDTRLGLLSHFSAELRGILMDTRLIVKIPQYDTTGSGNEFVTDKLFLLSATEAGVTESKFPVEGARLAMFSGNASRICYPTPEAVANSLFTNASLNAASPWHYWLRTAVVFTFASDVCCVQNGGSINGATARSGNTGARWALNVPAGALVSDTPDSDGAYVIQWNAAPNPPPGITVQGGIVTGKPLTASWGTATDPEGDAVTYDLERSASGAAFARVYLGPATAYTETAGSNWNTVQYRVRAVDGQGASSGYVTSPMYTVIHNVDPTISGQDVDLGAVTAPPSYAYQVGDADSGDTLTVTERLDGAIERTIPNAVRGTQYAFAPTKERYFALAAGPHTMTVTVTDSMGNSAERRVTFTRAVMCVDFDSPVYDTDVAAEQALVNMRVDPPGARLELMVCNNACDDNPAWEHLDLSIKHIFVNKSKTAARWGVKLRIKAIPTAECPHVTCGAPSVAVL